MMPYWLRVAMGAILGLFAAGALWLLVGIPWLTATVAALLAAGGFLGSYFVWSADRLPEYEQVLFDRPNTIVASVLIVAFAAAGIGTGFLGAGAPAPMAPEDRVAFLYADYQHAADAFTKQEADAEATIATMEELRVESDRIALELEALPGSEVRDHLVEANDMLALAMDSMKACASGEKSQCMDARLTAADAKAALERVLPPEPVEDEGAAVPPEP